MREALADHRRGPERPHNRLPVAREQRVVELCHDRPTWSSYQVLRCIGPDAPSPRTIQRVRQRQGLSRLPKRAPAIFPSRRLNPATLARAQAMVREKPWLGPDRAAWDLQNGEHLTVSPSTIKRLKRQNLAALLPSTPPPPAWRFYERHHPHSLWHGDFLEKITLSDSKQTAYQLTLLDDYSRGYVFCDLFLNPDMRTTIRALIAAMRQWQVIPAAVVFDNGSAFKGKLLSAFCEQVGIRLIHTAVNHPQTNGKRNGRSGTTCGISTDNMTHGCSTRYGGICPVMFITATICGGIAPWAGSLPSPDYGSRHGWPFLPCLSDWKAAPATKQAVNPSRKPGSSGCLAGMLIWERTWPIWKSRSLRVWRAWKPDTTANAWRCSGITAHSGRCSVTGATFSRRPSISSPASQAPVRELLTHIHNDPIHHLTPSVPCLAPPLGFGGFPRRSGRPRLDKTRCDHPRPRNGVDPALAPSATIR